MFLTFQNYYSTKAPAIVAVIKQAKVAANNALIPNLDRFPC